MGFDGGIFSVPLAIKILTGLFTANAINDLSGSRFSNFIFGGFKPSEFKSNFDKEMEASKNQNTRTRRRGNFFNFNRKNQTTGQARRDGILSFLGDRSRKLDDAPDIVEKNESVLSGIRTFGLGGLLPQSNVVPSVSNEKISDPSYEGVRKEIDKINRNIEAISSAMLQSALLDEDYRDQIIADMRKDLVEKGKDRSKTRTDKSIFNLLTRPKKQFKETAKSLSAGMSKAFAVSLGAAELFGLGADIFGEGGEEENKNEKTEENNNKEMPPGSNNNNQSPKVGDYYRGKNRKYYILQSDGTFKKGSHVKPKEGRQFKKEDFDVVVEGMKSNKNNNFEAGFFTEITEEDIRRERLLDAEEDNLLSSADDFYEFDPKSDNSLITMLMSGDYKPVGDISRNNFFDLRKNLFKEQDMTGSGKQVAGSGLETEIAFYDPSLGPSVWESFSRSIG